MPGTRSTAEAIAEQFPPEAPPNPAEPRPIPYISSSFIPGRDVRAKRPAALGFLLRLDTARRFARVVSLLALDFVALFAALFTALCLKAALRDKLNTHVSYEEARHTIAFAYLVMVLLFARSSLYAERSARPGLSRITASLFQVTVVTLIFAVVNGNHFASYWIFYGSLFFSVIYVCGARWVYQRVTGIALRAAGYERRAVLVGTGHHIEAVHHALSNSNDLVVVGFVSLTPRPDNGLRSLGRLDEIERVLDDNDLDEVIIADPDFPEQHAVDLVDRCHQKGVRVRVAPSTMEILIQRAELVPGQSVPLFELKPPVFEGVDFAVKRAFDFVGSTLILLVISPVLLAIALAVRASSRGPIIYRSVRPGIGGEPFACFKFRTMLRDADQTQADLESFNEASGALFKIRDDPRMTRVGRFLRRFSLDELPQLVNVLAGDMSLVGPRPLPQRDYDQLADWHKKRYLVLPGITGLWQVSGRSDLDFDDLVRLDFLYLERWSPALDLTILVKTIPAVFSRRGAF